MPEIKKKKNQLCAFVRKKVKTKNSIVIGEFLLFLTFSDHQCRRTGRRDYESTPMVVHVEPLERRRSKRDLRTIRDDGR